MAQDSAAAYKALVNFGTIAANTRWNPPIPYRAMANSPLKNPVGWIAADPMPITGYDIKPPDAPESSTPYTPVTQSTQQAVDAANKDNLGLDQRTYGFRFLMNPTTYSEAYTSASQLDPISFVRTLSEMSQASPSQNSGSSADLELFLSRRDDMHLLRRPNWQDYYPSPLSAEDREQLLQRGTLYDLEFIFRMLNGKRQKVWWDTTDLGAGDWGVFIPRPVIISLGGPSSIRLRAILSAFSVSHTIMAPGMIPVVTTLKLGIERMLDQTVRLVDWSEDTDPPPVTPADIETIEQQEAAMAQRAAEQAAAAQAAYVAAIQKAMRERATQQRGGAVLPSPGGPAIPGLTLPPRSPAPVNRPGNGTLLDPRTTTRPTPTPAVPGIKPPISW